MFQRKHIQTIHSHSHRMPEWANENVRQRIDNLAEEEFKVRVQNQKSSRLKRGGIFAVYNFSTSKIQLSMITLSHELYVVKNLSIGNAIKNIMQ